MSLQLLKEVQGKIAEAEKNQIRNTTLLDEAMKAIKRDFGCESLEDLDKKIEEAEKTREKKQGEYEAKVKKLESMIEV